LIRNIPGAWRRLASLALAAFACMQLAGCGGSVSPLPTPPSVGPLAIAPSTATLYSDLPTTFVITGGSGVYTVVSSDQSIVPVAGLLNGASFTVAPNQVATDTQVTLTVRDNAGSLPVTAALTVKPRTINNSVTVTPSSSQSAACGTAICSGGDAEVKAVLSQAGVPLASRMVRFDVVSGDLGIITSAPGNPETTATTATVVSDSTGTARVRIRVSPDATSQTAILQITDVSSGFAQTTSVAIAASTNAPLNAQPNTIRFTGPNSTTCSTGTSADVIVFGGRPPYQISQSTAYTVDPLTVANSGDHFTITSTGQCSQQNVDSSGNVTFLGTPIAIVDANGGSEIVTVINTPAPATPATSPFAVAPGSVTLDSCQSQATVALVGGAGLGHYFAASGSNAVLVDVVGNKATIRRQVYDPGGTGTGPISTGPLPSPVNLAFSDGQTTQPVTVTLTGQARTDTCH
jgi:hypothetical protein